MASPPRAHRPRTGHPLGFKALVCHDGVFNTKNTFYGTEELYFPEQSVRVVFSFVTEQILSLSHSLASLRWMTEPVADGRGRRHALGGPGQL
jgi:hypothetical protein